MIDVENMVVDTVRKAVIALYPTADIVSEYVDVPSSFPCVSVIEGENSSYFKTKDNDLIDHHINVMYEINVYSNLKSKKKEQAKKIMGVVDTALQNIKFTRTFKQPIPNSDKTIYRIVARYEAVIGAEQTVGSDKIYQVYRK